MEPVTFTLSSCNRFDLLQRTLDSLFANCNYPIHRFILTEDSTDESMKQKIIYRYGNRVELVFNKTNLGPIVSNENMYKSVETEYIFHCEDDWEFNGNPNFISDSLSILKERNDIHQVWIRTDVSPTWLENPILFTKDNIQYKMVKEHHISEWSGFSFNPGLRRKSDFIKIFPDGFNLFKKHGHVYTEYECNLHANKFNYRAASLKNAICKHIGHGRTSCK